jgi:hypothetical protein
MYDKFIKTFEIEKVKVKVPAREVDNDGNVAAWYEEEMYPEIIDGLFFDLLFIHNDYVEYHKRKIDCTNMSEVKLVKALLQGLYVAYYSIKQVDEEKAKEFKKDIQDSIKEYYADIEGE